ncbi:MAG: acyltransferase family protein [Planctomycetota bacterium]|nr:acyltransferase family protein [Planctomycetota bacterium]
MTRATMTLEPGRQRYHGLDALRAFAMLLGVVIHVALYFQETPPDAIWPIRGIERSPFAGLLVIAIHVFRMPLFFVMAGFFAAMMLDRRGATRFVGNRLLRIGLPFVVGWFILFPLVKFSFIFAMFHGGGVDVGDSIAGAASTLATEGAWSDASPIHLWFLYYLLILYAGVLAAGLLVRSIPPLGRAWQWIASCCITGRWRLPILITATFGLLTTMDMPGADTPTDFVPQIRVLLYYGFFLLVGWALWKHRGAVGDLHRWSWLRLLLGLFALGGSTVLMITYFVTAFEGAGFDSTEATVLYYLTQAVIAATVWLVILGGIGVAERVMRRHHPVIRYLVDASYWIYLAHLPLCVFLPALLRNWELDGTVQMFVLMALVTVLLLVVWQALLGIIPSRRPVSSPRNA